MLALSVTLWLAVKRRRKYSNRSRNTVRTAHGMDELSPELAEKVRSGIREEGEEKAA